MEMLEGLLLPLVMVMFDLVAVHPSLIPAPLLPTVAVTVLVQYVKLFLELPYPTPMQALLSSTLTIIEPLCMR